MIRYRKCCATFELYGDYAKYYEPDKGDKITFTCERFIIVETTEQYYDFLIKKFFSYGPYCRVLFPFNLRNYYLRLLRQTISAQKVIRPY